MLPTPGWTPVYEHLRDAVLHDRARAFPLGLGVLIAKGITAWQRLTASILAGVGAAAIPAAGAAAGTGTVASPQPPGPAPAGPAALAGPAPLLPQEVATQLVHALAGLAVALTGT